VLSRVYLTADQYLYYYCELVEDVWDSFFNLLSAHIREVAGCEVILTNIQCI